MAEADRRWTRRDFLGLAAVSAVGAALPAGAARAAVAADPVPQAAHPFVSRPDLVPPNVVVDVAAAGTVPGHIFLAPFVITGTVSSHSGAMIVDERGQLVWFKAISKKTAMDLRVQTYRGGSVLTWYEGDVLGGYGGDYVIADRHYRELARVSAGNGRHGDLHEFLITSRGTALVTIYQLVPADLTSLGGPAAGQLVEGIVQEIDIPSGRVLFEWRSSEHVALDESYLATVSKQGSSDYFHLNSVAVDADGHLLVSARHTSAVYKVDRKTGDVLWRLGGKRSDFAFDPGASFSFQHDVRRHRDGTLTIFDNAASAPAAPGHGTPAASRVVRLTVDEGRMLAGLVAEYLPPRPRLAWAMGNAQQLPDGGLFVDWGTAGAFTEFGPAGDVRFDASFGDASVSYRAFRFPWVGLPGGRPAVAASRSGGNATLHVTWNGATEVARWLVRSASGAALARARRSGFETSIALPAGHRSTTVTVTALDAHGRPLGTSAPVRL